jgi:putative Mg2+ transporter-C (MgtC) family protein
VRLLAALTAGALIGYERERVGKAAGLRTHMLVSMGTALFVISALEFGMGEVAMSRVIQGLVTGIGFLGAGVIMKIRETREICGLTTAAGIRMTAAVSVAIGLGQIGFAVLAALVAWVVLAALSRLELGSKPGTRKPARSPRDASRHGRSLRHRVVGQVPAAFQPGDRTAALPRSL